MGQSRHIAVIGAGIAGITCARTLAQAGNHVRVFEKSAEYGGRMATRTTEFGSFDHGAQYFTVRDTRFALALQTTPGICKPWSASTVRLLDEHGRVAAAGLHAREAHWIPTPGMRDLVAQWATPLADTRCVALETRVTRIARDPNHPRRWQLHAVGPDTQNGHEHMVFAGFDAVVLATPSWQASELLRNSEIAAKLVERIDTVQVAPCWTLMLAYPQAMQPDFSTSGPQWNAARSTHHRIAWLARESSKPARAPIERWTVQASADWSAEHFADDPGRASSKLRKAFAEVTGIRSEPAHAVTHRWAYAKTLRPLGNTHLWDAHTGIGACGDWCIGHRVEDGFVSGLELAFAVV